MTLKVINPYDQSVVVEMAMDNKDAIAEKMARAEEAYQVWKNVPLEKRQAMLRKALEKFRANSENIAKEITMQMGKPITESQNEINTFFKRAEYMIDIAPDALKADVLPEISGFTRRIEHVPVGVVLDIAAWNYPLVIPVNVIIPALLAGNTVLIKHSAKTPLCGKAIVDAFTDLEIPHLVQDLMITHKQTEILLEDARIQYVAFTGSVPGGKAVYSNIANKRFIDVGLELGGKDPAYVAEDADLDFAAENLVGGAFYNAGQSCCGIERVYVHQNIYKDFIEKVQKHMKAYKKGDPLNEKTTLGPLASKNALKFLENQVDDAVTHGAKLLAGGKPSEGTAGNFFEPTLLIDVPQNTKVMQEESFGPILPIAKVKDDEEALCLMNDSDFGLTASVWTKDSTRAETFAKALDAGTIFQNRCDYLDPALPWTGVKDSGKGSSLSKYGFLYVTRRKSIHFRG
jgi:acyl-CoA reductase-like NAD-dependent aldehyde dehydrogenase